MRRAKRRAPEAPQPFEIQMSTLVLFISGELLLRKVVDSFKNLAPASCGDSYCQIDCACQCVEFVLIMSGTLTLTGSNFISYSSRKSKVPALRCMLATVCVYGIIYMTEL